MAHDRRRAAKGARVTGKGPLIVRLCNWVGEAVLSLPTLTMLADQGYDLQLIGKRWAVNLFEGHGWPVHVRATGRASAIRQLKELQHHLAGRHKEFACRPNMVLFTNSFSSALEARLAGLRPIGFNKEGRGMLLAHGVPWQPGLHAADNYWRIGTHFAGVTQARPHNLGLKPSARHIEQAAQVMQSRELKPGFVILCPFSGAADTTGKKLWPSFPELARLLHTEGHQVVLCPGPGEENQARRDFSTACILEGVDLGCYAALSQQAACTVSNDTGPGHLAAAAGSAVISVLGPDAAPMWWAQGDQVTILNPHGKWPTLSDVYRAVVRAMERP